MQLRHSLLLLLPLSLGALSLNGCFIAGAATGVVLAQEVMDQSTYVVQLQRPAEVIWEEVKVSLSRQATGPLTVDEALRAAVGTVDGRKVTVSVEAFDQRSSRMVIFASHYGMADGEAADTVTKQLIKDIQLLEG